MFQRAMATIGIESLRENQPPAAPLRSSRPCPAACEKSGLTLARLEKSSSFGAASMPCCQRRGGGSTLIGIRAEGAYFEFPAGARRIRFAREGLNTPQEQNRER
jgi:hypothetical protein